MLKFYYNAGPNPMKVALFLEESGLDYEPIPIDMRAGDQHKVHGNGRVVEFGEPRNIIHLKWVTGPFQDATPDNPLNPHDPF